MAEPGRAGAPIPVRLNGEPAELPAGSTVADVVAILCPDGRGVAVALDLEVVPRSRWADVRPGPGASIEIVTAAAGG